MNNRHSSDFRRVCMAIERLFSSAGRIFQPERVILPVKMREVEKKLSNSQAIINAQIKWQTELIETDKIRMNKCHFILICLPYLVQVIDHVGSEKLVLFDLPV